MHCSRRPPWLPEAADIPRQVADVVRADYDRLAEEPLPCPLDQYVARSYGIDLRSEYAGLPLRNPWGKASGQLSMTPHQIREDVEAGLAFVVLKTVIAEEEGGARSMQAWAVRESRMVVEPIVGRSGEPGWTVTWKGRGWWRTFEDYLEFVAEARQTARGSGTLIVPSCKYHLPAPGEASWRTGEYDFTTRRLLEAWQAGDSPSVPMPLETAPAGRS